MNNDAPESDYTDDDLLSIVKSERARSIGFDIDSELTEQREKALNYIKGEMPDVGALPNRSQAVSTDVADMVETILPDIMDILTGGEDIATFKPTGPEDEEAAEQETDYVLHTIMVDNPGFTILYSMVKDALEVKTGVVTFWSEKVEAPEPEQFRNQTQDAVMLAGLDGELLNLRAAEDTDPSDPAAQPLFDFEMARQGPKRRVRIAAVSPDDFTVGADTILLADATYCATRTRPRAQELLAEGIDADIVDQLPAFESLNTTERGARDTVGEHEKWDAAGAVFDLRQVEVTAHYIRLRDGDRSVIWRVLTGHSSSVLIKREIVNRIPFAAITPYLIPHRFYGLSVADKLMEIQRIKTALTRMGLDGGYFALNARNEVADSESNAFTIPDLLRNEPGAPIRSRTGNAVRPVQAGAMSFNAFEAMEVFSKVGEERTGIMRYGQGLKPDALHDTMGGAMVQLNSSQKRVRLMARLFVETGIKDLFLGVHALLREGGTQAHAKLRSKWVQVDPTTWGERRDMTIEIGVGSAGRDHDIMTMDSILANQEKIVEGQGGSLSGPLVNAANIYNAVSRRARLGGQKAPELFFTDPAQQQAQPPQPPPPDPKVIAAHLDAQNDAQRLAADQHKADLDHQAAMAKIALDARRAEMEHEAHKDKVGIEQTKLAIEDRRSQQDALDRAHLRQIKEAELAARSHTDAGKLHVEAQRNAQTHEAAMAGINERHVTAVTTTQMDNATDLAIQASEQRDTELEQAVATNDEPPE